MKLLTRQEAKKSIDKQNEELIDRNLRLKKIEKDVLTRINSSKVDLSNENNKALHDYEVFIRTINEKKSKLLKELNDINDEIERRKDIYYGLIQKQDELGEKFYQLRLREDKIELREQFVSNLENKISNK